MAKEIHEWQTTDADNDFATPDGWPEGMNKSDINNCARAMMGVLARWYDDGGEWLNLFSTYTVSRNSVTVVKVAAVDVSSYFTTGRRLKMDGGVSAQYGVVASVVFSSPDTLVTVTVDGGADIDAATDELYVHSCNESLGTAAWVDTGTSAANVPTQSDIGQTLPLGSAAVVDTGTDGADVPTVTDLGQTPPYGTIVAKDVPQNKHQVKDTADQTVTGADETAIIWTGTSVLVAFPGADDTKDYNVWVTLVRQTVAITNITIRFLHGSSTTPSANTDVWESEPIYMGAALYGPNLSIGPIRFTDVPTGDSFMLTVQHATSTSTTWSGSATAPTTQFCCVEIQEVL